MMLRKFDKMYEKISTEINGHKKEQEVKQEKYLFDTYKEAREFLNKNYNGHGPIYDINGELIETCRCMKQIHDQLHIPYVQCKETVEEHEKQFENTLKNLNIV